MALYYDEPIVITTRTQWSSTTTFAHNSIQADTVYNRETGEFVVTNHVNGKANHMHQTTKSCIEPRIRCSVHDVELEIESHQGGESTYSNGFMTSRWHGLPKSKLATNVISMAFTKTAVGTQFYDPSVHKIGGKGCF